MRRLILALPLAALLLMGAAAPTFAQGAGRHSANCGHHALEQSHTTLRTGAHRIKTCPVKPIHPSHPAPPNEPKIPLGQSWKCAAPGALEPSSGGPAWRCVPPAPHR
jgi:hypothetical protein